MRLKSGRPGPFRFGVASLGRARVTLLHDHEHRLRLGLVDQVVEDEVDAALVWPAAFVLTTAVLEVQHRIADVAIVVVTGWSVDEDSTPCLGGVGEVPALADLAVRTVFGEVVINGLFGDLNPAGHLASAVERLAGGVVDLRAVDKNAVVVEPWNLGLRRRGPEAVLALLAGIPLVIEEPEDDLLSVGGLDAERHAQVGIDLGILRASDVRGRGNGIGGLRTFGLDGGRGEEERKQSSKPRAVHQRFSLVSGIGKPVDCIIRSLRPSRPARPGRSGRALSSVRCRRSDRSLRV